MAKKSHLHNPTPDYTEPLRANLSDETQELLLASKLKRLSDQLFQAQSIIYNTQNIQFEPSWFMVFQLLYQNGSLNLVQIAEQMGVTHSAISQIINELNKQKLVETAADPKDKRKKIAKLTKEGSQLCKQLVPIWKDMATSIRELMLSTGYDLFDVVEKSDKALQSYPLAERFYDKLIYRKSEEIEILVNQLEYMDAFESLNRQWLETYFKVEPIDEQYFKHPKKMIIDPGGYILFAKEKDQIIGTCALLPTDTPDAFELGKMAIDRNEQGRHVGEKILGHAIHLAKENKKKLLYLEMNSQFIRSVQMYRKLGFTMAAFETDPKYQRSDLLLKLNL